MKNVLEYSERCGEPVEGTLEIPKSSTWYAELGFHTWRRVGVAGSRRGRWGSAADGGHAHVAPGERMGPRAHRQVRRAGVTGSRRWGSAADSGHAHAAPGEQTGPRAHRRARRAGVAGSRRGRWGRPRTVDTRTRHQARRMGPRVHRRARGAGLAKETAVWESAARGVERTGGASWKRGAVPSLVDCCVVLRCAVWGLEKKRRSKLLCC
jgi:hypothetical protein